MAKILVILSCNPGALHGDYFLGLPWEKTLRSLNIARVNKRYVDFAAVDEIIPLFDPRADKYTKGAIVLESEMDRVKGYDLKPKWENFTKDEFELLGIMTQSIQISLHRVIPKYEYIIINVSNRGYKLSMIRALIRSYNDSIPKNVVMLDTGESPGGHDISSQFLAGLIKHYILTGNKKYGGKIVKQKRVPIMFLQRPTDLPEIYKYWNKPYYICVDE